MRGSGPKPPAEFPPKSPDKFLNYVGSWFKASRRLEQTHTSKLRDEDDPPRAKEREGERERKLQEDEEGRQKELEVDERGQGHSCDEELRMKDVALVRL